MNEALTEICSQLVFLLILWLCTWSAIGPQLICNCISTQSMHHQSIHFVNLKREFTNLASLLTSSSYGWKLLRDACTRTHVAKSWLLARGQVQKLISHPHPTLGLTCLFSSWWEKIHFSHDVKKDSFPHDEKTVLSRRSEYQAKSVTQCSRSESGRRDWHGPIICLLSKQLFLIFIFLTFLLRQIWISWGNGGFLLYHFAC